MELTFKLLVMTWGGELLHGEHGHCPVGLLATCRLAHLTLCMLHGRNQGPALCFREELGSVPEM